MIKQIKTSLIALILITSFTADAQVFSKRKSKKDTHNFRYEIECIGEGKQGTYAIKVYSYSKKPKVAIEAAKILFAPKLFLFSVPSISIIVSSMSF